MGASGSEGVGGSVKLSFLTRRSKMADEKKADKVVTAKVEVPEVKHEKHKESPERALLRKCIPQVHIELSKEILAFLEK